MPSPKEKRRVSFGSITTFGHPSNANFGGSGFGTPKYIPPNTTDSRDEPKSPSRREEDDTPPSASIYDTGRSSPFPRQLDTPRRTLLPFALTTEPSPPPENFSLFSQTPNPSPIRTDPTPVIVFGFPVSHSLLIIREYEKYGPILEHFSSTHASLPSSIPLPPREIVHGGNWIRITYADPVSAARATATNGQIIGGAYMIGVVYAPKSQIDVPNEETETPRRDEPGRIGTPGERKMNVVKGGRMFATTDKRSEQVGWGAWTWNQMFGSGEKKEGQVGVVGAGQVTPVTKAIRGLSEAVFGF